MKEIQFENNVCPLCKGKTETIKMLEMEKEDFDKAIVVLSGAVTSANQTLEKFLEGSKDERSNS